MSVRLATGVRWNTTVTFIATHDKIISSKLTICFKMSQMREKAFIILQDWVLKYGCSKKLALDFREIFLSVIYETLCNLFLSVIYETVYTVYFGRYF